MDPFRRKKFLATSMRSALGALRRFVAVGGDPAEGRETHEAEGSPREDADGKSSDGIVDPPGPEEGYEDPPPAATKAIARAAEMAAAFLGPLIQQAGEERARASTRVNLEACTRQGATGAEAPAAEEEGSAADQSLASCVGFGLSALGIISARTVCRAASERKTEAAVAEDGLVDLVVGGSAVDLAFLLRHGYRVSYAKRRARGTGGPLQPPPTARKQCSSSRLGELLAAMEEHPDALAGASALAYLVSGMRWNPRPGVIECEVVAPIMMLPGQAMACPWDHVLWAQRAPGEPCQAFDVVGDGTRDEGWIVHPACFVESDGFYGSWVVILGKVSRD